ncbi:hypothetical protein [Streptomyces meridianus]|uniref:DUF8175 domain-containing protein n=1 Tax=Streptomyces meridianus TaxID=2938945 RepID=A0ABT0X486_9ACTN|nr:hypothetical protein [Streptomyces meridianus]MCM2577347.1 hypothetical protein [Streptomyces meridianus]
MSSGDDFYGGDRTRTRLPEGEGTDTYGTKRLPSRSSRGLITVVSVVVLLVAAIAFANRGNGGGGPADDPGRSGAGAPTAPSGETPVRAGDGDIPSGFPKTEQGAQSAAANYAVALVSADILKAAQRKKIVRQLFVSSKVDELDAKFDKAYSKDFLSKLGLDANGNAAEGMTYIARTAPIGTKATAFSPASATVEVWCTGAFGTAGVRSTNPVANDWFTMTLQLRWRDGDWKVESFKQEEGPAPVNSDRKASSADEIAKAVEEYGGFTYAR